VPTAKAVELGLNTAWPNGWRRKWLEGPLEGPKSTDKPCKSTDKLCKSTLIVPAERNGTDEV